MSFLIRQFVVVVEQHNQKTSTPALPLRQSSMDAPLAPSSCVCNPLSDPINCNRIYLLELRPLFGFCLWHGFGPLVELLNAGRGERRILIKGEGNVENMFN
jgi:hypothetical protein